MTRIALITAADAGYAALAADTLASARARARASDRAIDYWLLDCGLDEAQAGAFRTSGVQVVAPGDDYPAAPIADRWFRAMKARPNLPKWVPGYDLYIWLDADAWVQDGRALDHLIEGATRFGLVAVAEDDPAYPAHLASAADGRERAVAEIYAEIYADLFADEAVARDLAARPCINCGVFAATAASPLWTAWADLTGRLMRPGTRHSFYAEQSAFNFIIRRGDAPSMALPSWCNWLCNLATPALGGDGRTLVHPHHVSQPLGIVHMAGNSKQRYLEAYTCDGAAVALHVRYLPS